MTEWNTLAAGILFLFAGLCGLVRHFLLEPTLPAEVLPKTPRWLLRIFFGFATVMAYVGLRYILIWNSGLATTVPPGVTGLSVLIAGTIFTYKGALLADTLTRKPDFTLDDIITGLKRL
jgi:hypothetical protein